MAPTFSANPLADLNQLFAYPFMVNALQAGTIVAVEGDEPERKFTVRFSDHGTKKLVEQYANLSWA